MTRYVKQKDQVSCGPVAILNVLKWAGHKFTSKDLHLLSVLLRKEDGTEVVRISRFLSAAFYTRRYSRITLKELDRILSNDQITLVAYWQRDKKANYHGHYVLIENKTKTGYWCINLDKKGKTRDHWSRHTISNLIKQHSKYHPFNEAWSIQN